MLSTHNVYMQQTYQNYVFTMGKFNPDYYAFLPIGPSQIRAQLFPETFPDFPFPLRKLSRKFKTTFQRSQVNSNLGFSLFRKIGRAGQRKMAYSPPGKNEPRLGRICRKRIPPPMAIMEISIRDSSRRDPWRMIPASGEGKRAPDRRLSGTENFPVPLIKNEREEWPAFFLFQREEGEGSFCQKGPGRRWHCNRLQEEAEKIPPRGEEQPLFY